MDIMEEKSASYTTHDRSMSSLLHGYGWLDCRSHELNRPKELTGVVMVTLTGSPWFWHGQTKVVGGRGSVTYYPTHADQHFGCKGRWGHYWFHLDLCSHLGELAWRLGVTGDGITWKDALPGEELNQLGALLTYPTAYPSHVARYLATMKLEQLLTSCLIPPHERIEQDPKPLRLAEVVDYMRHNLAAPHTVAGLARLAHLSESRFAHLFREEFGRSPIAFLQKLRIDSAKTMIRETEDTVAMISQRLGYKTPYIFYAAYKKEEGHPPGVYVRKVRKTKGRR